MLHVNSPSSQEQGIIVLEHIQCHSSIWLSGIWQPSPPPPPSPSSCPASWAVLPGTWLPELLGLLEVGSLGPHVSETLFFQVLRRQEPEARGGHTAKGHPHLAALLLPVLGHLPEHRAPAPALGAGPGSRQVSTAQSPGSAVGGRHSQLTLILLDVSTWDRKL